MRNILTLFTSLSLLIGTLNAQLVVEQFLFEDGLGTNITASTNEVGTASFTGAASAGNILEDSNGDMVFGQQGASENYFNSATLTNSYTSGVLELAFTITGYSFSGSDPTGANAGFGLCGSDGVDLFLFRLQKQNDTARLQHRIGTSNSNLENFGNLTNAFSTLDVRAVVDLGTDLVDFYWSIDSGSESSALDVAIGGNGVGVSSLRVAANLNNTDMASGDFIAFESLTLTYTAVPEPSTYGLLLGCASLGLILVRRQRR